MIVNGLRRAFLRRACHRIALLPSSPTIGQKETEKEVTALVSPKDGGPDSAAAAAIVVDGGRGQIFYLVRHIGSKITHFRGKT